MKALLSNLFSMLMALSLFNSVSLSAQEVEPAIKLPVIIDAKPLERKPPKYPRNAARKGQEGWVIINYVIDEKGNVVDPIIEQTSGLKSFNKAALKSIKSWKYSPATKDGEPIEQCRKSAKLDFRFKEGGNVSKGFYYSYRELLTAIDKNDLNEAKFLLTEIYNDQLWNYTESSFYWLADSMYAKVIDAPVRELSSINKALATKNKKLQANNISYLLERQFYLNLSSTYYIKALTSFYELEEGTDNGDLISALSPYVLELKKLIESDEAMIRNALLDEKGGLHHELSRSRFGLVVKEGELSGLEIRCDNKRSKFLFKKDIEWKIPEAWGKCNVILLGEEGSQVDIVELGDYASNA